MSEEKEQFTGEKLKELRKKYGLKQQEVADGIGVMRNKISQWENNYNKISNIYQKVLKDFFKNL